MSASNEDISLTIIANGERAFYSGVKGVGNLIFDTRLGMFSGHIPKPSRALDFIAGTDWEYCVEALGEPIQNPVYGSVTIDFDKKIVTDENGYGPSDRIFFAWLVESVRDAIKGSDGLIPRESLLEHFRFGRIQLLAGLTPYGNPLQFDSLESANKSLAKLKEAVWESERKSISFACISMPEGWAIQHSADAS